MKIQRRTVFRVLAVVVAVGVILSLLGIGLFRSDPSWYRRVKLTEEQQAAGQQRLLDQIATLRNAVGRTEASVPATTRPVWPSFDIALTEDDVNGVIMRWSQSDPSLKYLLRHIQEPHLRFLDDRIEFAGRVDTMDVLVSFELSVTQTQDGPRVQLSRPWAGRLPMARSFLVEPGAQAVEAMRQANHTSVPPDVVEALAKLIDGDEVAPMVPVPSSLQGDGLLAARVERLTIADGVLKATLRPVK